MKASGSTNSFDLCMNLEQRTPQDAIKMAAGLRDRGEINPHAWLRAVVGSTIHRRDLQGLRKPPMVEIMPSMFITNNVLSALRRSIDVPSSSRVSYHGHMDYLRHFFLNDR